MITCPVCSTPNSDLIVKCRGCGAFLQSKVDVLDLFVTMWKVIETPATGFRQIALATHKNYVLLLGSLFGIAAVFSVFRLGHAGDLMPNLFVLLLAGLLAGPLIGIGLLVAAGTVSMLVGRKIGGEATVRNSYSVIAYAMVPLVLSLVFVFPVEVGVFGLPLFSSNPPASVLKPVIYSVLFGINVLAVLWTVRLLVDALAVVNGLGRWKGLLLTSFLVAGPLAGVLVLAD